jgi:hypothetical protein
LSLHACPRPRAATILLGVHRPVRKSNIVSLAELWSETQRACQVSDPFAQGGRSGHPADSSAQRQD